MKRIFVVVACFLSCCILGCSSPEFTGAKVYMQKRNWTEAIRLLEIEVKKNPTNETAWFYLGGLKSDQGDIEAMNRAFDECLKLSPKYAADIATVRAKFDIGHYLSRNYEKDLRMSSTIGNAMLSVKLEEKNKKSGAVRSSSSSELIYSGKAGSIIKVVYREFTDDMARPAFTQELQYDMNDTKTIKFKNTTIEVLQVTNQEISYRVLNSPHVKYKTGLLPKDAEIDLF